MFKIVIVDDEPQIRTGLRTLMKWERFGFQIAGEASDGVAALALVEQSPPDLIITDVKMPRMDGMELSKKLYRKYPHIFILVLSGYNEFAYAKGALQAGAADYLLKPVCPDELGLFLERIYEQLSARLRLRMKEREQANMMKDVYLNKLVLGEVYGELAESDAVCNINLQEGPFRLMLVIIRNYGDLLITMPEYEIKWKRFALGNVMNELLPQGCILFEMKAEQFGILLTGEAYSEKHSRRLAERIIECTLQYTKEPVLVGIGEIAAGRGELPYACQSAKTALEQRFFWPNHSLFEFRQEDYLTRPQQADWDDKAVCAAIREGSKARIEEEIRFMLEPLLSCHISLGTLKLMVISTIIKLARMTEEHYGDWQSFYTGRFEELEAIMAEGSLPQLGKLLSRIALDISGHIRSVTGRKLDSRIHEIIEHIQQNYREELNLKELSKLFFINTVYLGQLFKKETGHYFNDYVNQVRLKHAARLLLETNWSAAEIAKAAGYKYVDHFYRLFKQQMAMTPGEYRKANCLV